MSERKTSTGTPKKAKPLTSFSTPAKKTPFKQFIESQSTCLSGKYPFLTPKQIRSKATKLWSQLTPGEKGQLPCTPKLRCHTPRTPGSKKFFVSQNDSQSDIFPQTPADSEGVGFKGRYDVLLSTIVVLLVSHEKACDMAGGFKNYGESNVLHIRPPKTVQVKLAATSAKQSILRKKTDTRKSSCRVSFSIKDENNNKNNEAHGPVGPSGDDNREIISSKKILFTDENDNNLEATSFSSETSLDTNSEANSTNSTTGEIFVENDEVTRKIENLVVENESQLGNNEGHVSLVQEHLKQDSQQDSDDEKEEILAELHTKATETKQPAKKKVRKPNAKRTNLTKKASPALGRQKKTETSSKSVKAAAKSSPKRSNNSEVIDNNCVEKEMLNLDTSENLSQNHDIFEFTDTVSSPIRDICLMDYLEHQGHDVGDESPSKKKQSDKLQQNEVVPNMPKAKGRKRKSLKKDFEETPQKVAKSATAKVNSPVLTSSTNKGKSAKKRAAQPCNSSDYNAGNSTQLSCPDDDMSVPNATVNLKPDEDSSVIQLSPDVNESQLNVDTYSVEVNNNERKSKVKRKNNAGANSFKANKKRNENCLTSEAVGIEEVQSESGTSTVVITTQTKEQKVRGTKKKSNGLGEMSLSQAKGRRRGKKNVPDVFKNQTSNKKPTSGGRGRGRKKATIGVLEKTVGQRRGRGKKNTIEQFQNTIDKYLQPQTFISENIIQKKASENQNHAAKNSDRKFNFEGDAEINNNKTKGNATIDNIFDFNGDSESSNTNTDSIEESGVSIGKYKLRRSFSRATCYANAASKKYEEPRTENVDIYHIDVTEPNTPVKTYGRKKKSQVFNQDKVKDDLFGKEFVHKLDEGLKYHLLGSKKNVKDSMSGLNNDTDVEEDDNIDINESPKPVENIDQLKKRKSKMVQSRAIDKNQKPAVINSKKSRNAKREKQQSKRTTARVKHSKKTSTKAQIIDTESTSQNDSDRNTVVTVADIHSSYIIDSSDESESERTMQFSEMNKKLGNEKSLLNKSIDLDKSKEFENEDVLSKSSDVETPKEITNEPMPINDSINLEKTSAFIMQNKRNFDAKSGIIASVKTNVEEISAEKSFPDKENPTNESKGSEKSNHCDQQPEDSLPNEDIVTLNKEEDPTIESTKSNHKQKSINKAKGLEQVYEVSSTGTENNGDVTRSNHKDLACNVHNNNNLVDAGENRSSDSPAKDGNNIKDDSVKCKTCKNYMKSTKAEIVSGENSTTAADFSTTNSIDDVGFKTPIVHNQEMVSIVVELNNTQDSDEEIMDLISINQSMNNNRLGEDFSPEAGPVDAKSNDIQGTQPENEALSSKIAEEISDEVVPVSLFSNISNAGNDRIQLENNEETVYLNENSDTREMTPLSKGPLLTPNDDAKFKVPLVPDISTLESRAKTPDNFNLRTDGKRPNENSAPECTPQGNTDKLHDLVTPQNADMLVKITMDEASKAPHKHRPMADNEPTMELESVVNKNIKARKSLDTSVVSSSTDISSRQNESNEAVKSPKFMSPYEKRKAQKNKIIKAKVKGVKSPQVVENKDYKNTRNRAKQTSAQNEPKSSNKEHSDDFIDDITMEAGFWQPSIMSMVATAAKVESSMKQINLLDGLEQDDDDDIPASQMINSEWTLNRTLRSLRQIASPVPSTPSLDDLESILSTPCVVSPALSGIAQFLDETMNLTQSKSPPLVTESIVDEEEAIPLDLSMTGQNKQEKNDAVSEEGTSSGSYRAISSVDSNKEHTESSSEIKSRKTLLWNIPVVDTGLINPLESIMEEFFDKENLLQALQQRVLPTVREDFHKLQTEKRGTFDVDRSNPEKVAPSKENSSGQIQKQSSSGQTQSASEQTQSASGQTQSSSGQMQSSSGQKQSSNGQVQSENLNDLQRNVEDTVRVLRSKDKSIASRREKMMGMLKGIPNQSPASQGISPKVSTTPNSTTALKQKVGFSDDVQVNILEAKDGERDQDRTSQQTAYLAHLVSIPDYQRALPHNINRTVFGLFDEPKPNTTATLSSTRKLPSTARSSTELPCDVDLFQQGEADSFFL